MVYTTAPLSPIIPCQPTQAMAEPVFSYLWNPHPTFLGGVYDFYGRLYPGLGRPDGGFPDFRFWTCSDHKLHINTLELKAVILALHYWVSVIRGHQLMIATDNTTVVAYIPYPVTSSSGSVPMATNSRHSHPGQTHSRLSKPDSGLPKSAKPAHNNRVEPPPWNSDPDLQEVGNSNSGHGCHSPQQASSPVYVSKLEPRAQAIDVLSKDWQGRLMFMFPPFPLLSKVIQKLRTTQEAEVILIDPWWPSQPWFPHLLRHVDHPLFFPYRRELLSQQGYVSDGKSYRLRAGGSHAALPSSRIF